MRLLSSSGTLTGLVQLWWYLDSGSVGNGKFRKLFCREIDSSEDDDPAEPETLPEEDDVIWAKSALEERPATPSTMDSRPQSRGRFGVDLSPGGRSALEMTQRRLVLSGTRLSTASPVLCKMLQSAPLVRFVLSSRASLVFIRVSKAVDTM